MECRGFPGEKCRIVILDEFQQGGDFPAALPDHREPVRPLRTALLKGMAGDRRTGTPLVDMEMGQPRKDHGQTLVLSRTVEGRKRLPKRTKPVMGQRTPESAGTLGGIMERVAMEFDRYTDTLI